MQAGHPTAMQHENNAIRRPRQQSLSGTQNKAGNLGTKYAAFSTAGK